MSDPAPLELRIQGPDAERFVAELTRFIENEIEATPDVRTVQPVTKRNAVRSADPVAVAALILALPGALLATVDLAQRLKIRERIERLLWVSRDLTESSPTTKIELTDADGRTLRLDTASPDAVIEISMKSGSIRVRQERGDS